MTTPQLTSRTNPAKRNAFTLVELMIVIVIIGILVAISSPFLFGAIRVAKELTVTIEIENMDAAVERFQTQRGFYPPAIGPGLEINTAAGTAGRDAFLRYLNRIAPNHAERGAGLNSWWDEVGSNLDAESSLVFWLSGLCTSKQYPLSGNAMIALSGTPLAPYNANKDFNDDDLAVGITIDRDVFFDFVSGQLVDNPVGIPGIKSYNQPEGRGDLLAYRYRDFRSYGPIPVTNGRFVANAYHSGVDGSGNPINFFNPTTFQIISPGLDGQVTRQTDPMGTVITDTVALASPSDAEDVDPEQDDNITNFASGRLDTVFE